MKRAEPSQDVAGEFRDAALGDLRLQKRLTKVVRKVAADPKLSFPQAMATVAELEGFYRLIRNDNVTFETLLAPHHGATIQRIEAHETVLVVHDSTSFAFDGTAPREGLGQLNRSGHGFNGHIALALSADGERDPLGVLGAHTWARTEESATSKRKQKVVSYAESRELETEQRRWGDLVDAVEDRVGRPNALIHVMDSEADDYKLIAKLEEAQRRFIVRLCYDRCLDVDESNSAPHQKTKAFVATAKVVCKRNVRLSRRRRQPGGSKKKRTAARKERMATLGFSAVSLVLRRPGCAGSTLPRTLPVNIVRARELNPPRGVEPVEWLLITTEPIETEAQILAVVDNYRARWTVEEYFKALKSGCAYEERQMESMTTLLNVLAIFIPIAWSMLRLRALSRKKVPATLALTPTQIFILRHEWKKRFPKTVPVPRRLSTRDAIRAIARMGGHLPSNGRPGWQVLARGYNNLLMMDAGFRLRDEM
jgi:hypothetical protein